MRLLIRVAAWEHWAKVRRRQILPTTTPSSKPDIAIVIDRLAIRQTEIAYPTQLGQHWYNPPVILGTSHCAIWK